MILSISVTEMIQKNMVKTGFVYLFTSLLCFLFGVIYEQFSHEVYSYYMRYAFVFPLLGGALPFFCLSFFKNNFPGKVSRNIYHAGIETLTSGSIMQGVLEIYGTTNHLLIIYWWLGSLLVLISILFYAITVFKDRRGNSEQKEHDHLEL